eukprot:GEMP01091117.1.p1 GENE.GEMP01091117.1~~GEMP01091117.1.p1  ORF type:complete len:190 (+),score=35.51 GEMP01091117.1:64-633(+)
MNIDMSSHTRDPLQQPQVGSSLVSQGKFFMEKGIHEVRGHIQDSPSAIRAGSFVGGLCVIVVATLNVLNVFTLTYDCITYLVNVYQLLFGLITLFLEGKKTWWCVTSVQTAIYREAHFLSLINGRALFYIFEGSLFVIQVQFMSVLVGTYMVVLGLVMMYQGGKRGFVTSADVDTLMEPLDTPENAEPV